jgi:hypothetical protein
MSGFDAPMALDGSPIAFGIALILPLSVIEGPPVLKRSGTIRVGVADR